LLAVLFYFAFAITGKYKYARIRRKKETKAKERSSISSSSYPISANTTIQVTQAAIHQPHKATGS